MTCGNALLSFLDSPGFPGSCAYLMYILTSLEIGPETIEVGRARHYFRLPMRLS
jgi:hypothetical protein